MDNKGVGITVLLEEFLSGVTSDGRYLVCYHPSIKLMILHRN